MSFSSNVKEEISRHFGKARHCNIAELAAITNICGQILQFSNKFCLKIQTENFLVAKKCFTLLENAFSIKSEITIKSSGKGRRSRMYTLLIRDEEINGHIFQATGVAYRNNGYWEMRRSINTIVVSSICCRRGYIRGTFSAVGYVTDPRKNYHLEFVSASEVFAEELRDLINTFGLDSKVVERKDHYIVYLKEGEQIVDLLNVMEAHVALMELENIRILKEMRNDINRKVNCETANLNKVVHAAVKQIEDILYIKETVGLETLSPQLQEVAVLRLEYPDISLKELGTYMEVPVGKSGVNHRLRKIGILVESIREGKGEKL